MTTTPTNPSPSEFYRHCIRNGHTEMRALTEVLLTYLDEQHAAGSGEPKPGSFIPVRDPVSGDRIYGRAPATPETGERAPLYCSGGCGKPSPRNPTIAVKYTCAECAALEAAPIAEPPAPVAGEPPAGERNVCVICGLSGDFASCPNCNGDRGLMRYVPIARLNAAQARYERSQAQTDDYERALEAERRHTALLTQELVEARSQLASERAAHAVTRGQHDACMAKLAEKYEAVCSQVDALVAQKQCTQCLAALPASPTEPAPVAEPAQPATPLAPAGTNAEVEREILVGSVWRSKMRGDKRIVEKVSASDVHWVYDSKYRETNRCNAQAFRELYEWVADPPLAPTACNCMWPVAPIGPNHGARCPMYRFHAPTGETKGEASE